MSAVELLQGLIADLEGKLSLGEYISLWRNVRPIPTLSLILIHLVPAPGQHPGIEKSIGSEQNSKQKKKKANQKSNASSKKATAGPSADAIPDICKLEFKVGIINKVWEHEAADKLYCEEIDCGEDEPRQIASGLRTHYSLDEMLNKRVLVVSNLKAKKLVGFKSHGMVLCAAATQADGSERVEFVEPPEDAPLGEIVTFEGLPPPAPVSGAQVDKKKIFQACMDGMKTNDDCLGTWNGHVFMTSAGPCKAATCKGCPMR